MQNIIYIFLPPCRHAGTPLIFPVTESGHPPSVTTVALALGRIL